MDALQAELGIQIEFENDVNLAAIAERWHGLGREVDDFVLLSLGTGVGMGVVLGGRLHQGASGAAGEVGYLPIGPGDVHDRASRRSGTFEAAVGAAAVVALARQLGLGRAQPGGAMRPARTAEQVFAAARRGDAVAGRVVAQVAERIALGVAAVAAVLDPDLVVLGGGIGHNAGDLLLEPITRELRACSPFRPRIAVSALGADAVLRGALATALAGAQEQVYGVTPTTALTDIGTATPREASP
jgi:predicted NBD/HSP70 family sugar kinase